MKTDAVHNKINYDTVPKTVVLAALISRFDNRYQAEADSFLGDISWKQMSFLRIVKSFCEAPTVRDMADFIGCSHQNANMLAKRLERSGYIAMKQDSLDRRYQRLYLTEKAEKLIIDKEEKAVSLINVVFSDMAEEEIDAAIKLASKLNYMIDNTKSNKEQ